MPMAICPIVTTAQITNAEANWLPCSCPNIYVVPSEDGLSGSWLYLQVSPEIRKQGIERKNSLHPSFAHLLRRAGR